MALAIAGNRSLLFKFPEVTGFAAVASMPMTDIDHLQMQKAIWILSENVVEANYICLFIEGITMYAPSSFQLPPALQGLYDHYQQGLIRLENERAVQNLHRCTCSTGTCLNYVEDASLLFPCHRCSSVKYCSSQCQYDDWRSHSFH